MLTPELVKSATIIDVRNPWEFDLAHAEGALNIPLHELPSRIVELRDMHTPLLLCCASGNRSAQATHYLKGEGVDAVYNGGSWLEVNGLLHG